MQPTAFVSLYLGECLTAEDRYAEAEPLLLQSYDNLRASAGEKSEHVIEAVTRLVTLYERWRKPGLATKYRALLPRV